MSLFRKLRKPCFLLVYPIAVTLFLVARTTKRSLHVGVLIVLIGESIRLWANGYVGHRKVNQTSPGQRQAKVGHLITAGPYAFVRHPLYLGTMVIGAGLCVIMGNLWLALVALAVFIVVYQRKMSEEEATIRHEWGEAFEDYRRAVPQWLPSGRRYPRRDGQWSWRGIRASKELKTLAWVVVVLILLSFRLELLQEHERLLERHQTQRILLLALLAVLVVGDGVFALRQWRAARSKSIKVSG